MADLTHTALGAWSGGRFLHFGEPIDEDRLVALLRPGDGIDTVITADAYGAGAADEIVGRALAGLPRESYRLVGAIGHDFYDGERQGAKGYQRFTDPALRGAGRSTATTSAWRPSAASSAAASIASTCCCCTTRTARASRARPSGTGMRAVRDAGLTDTIGVAPGPANGFTLDLIDCLERFGADIDWAMVILNPFEPWPGELVLDAAERSDVKLITRVVDYGGMFHGDVAPGPRVRPARPPHVPSRRLGRGRLGAARARAADRRAPRADDAPARVPVEPRARAGEVRRADADPGARRRRAPGRGAARRARRALTRAGPAAPRTSPRSARSATTPAAWR